MFEIIIKIIGLASISFLIAKGAQPIQDIKSLLIISNDSEYKNKIQWFILQLVNCSLCTGFWIGLLFTQSIIIAGIVSVVSELIDRKISK